MTEELQRYIASGPVLLGFLRKQLFHSYKRPEYEKILSLLFVCVEVLRPSQPNGVMSSVVSLPNHTFTGQA